MRATDSYPTDDYCVFRVGRDAYAIAAGDVREAVEAVPIVEVPQSPSCLAGLCHLRNEFVPVLSLHSLIKGTTAGDNEIRYLLVIDTNNGAWALAISQVMGLERLELASTNGSHEDTASRLFFGTASFRDEVIRVLDANRLYRVASDFLNHMWSPESSHKTGCQDIATQLSIQTVS